jgi:hypothetical protein
MRLEARQDQEQAKPMQWVLNGKEKVNQVNIFHLNGAAHKHIYKRQQYSLLDWKAPFVISCCVFLYPCCNHDQWLTKNKVERLVKNLDSSH